MVTQSVLRIKIIGGSLNLLFINAYMAKKKRYYFLWLQIILKYTNLESKTEEGNVIFNNALKTFYTYCYV